MGDVMLIGEVTKSHVEWVLDDALLLTGMCCRCQLIGLVPPETAEWLNTYKTSKLLCIMCSREKTLDRHLLVKYEGAQGGDDREYSVYVEENETIVEWSPPNVVPCGCCHAETVPTIKHALNINMTVCEACWGTWVDGLKLSGRKHTMLNTRMCWTKPEMVSKGVLVTTISNHFHGEDV